ncbi:MAG: hypothetical protein AAFV49_17870 [Pseudomonadota bacterium]
MFSGADSNLASRVFWAGFGFLLVWTIGVQFVTLSRQPFHVLYGTLALAIVAGAVAAIRSPSLSPAGSLNLPSIVLTGICWRGVRRTNLAFLLMFVSCMVSLVVAMRLSGGSAVWVFWSGCLLAAAFSFFFAGRLELLSPFRILAEHAASRYSSDQVFLFYFALSVIFYFFFSVPDADDSLFQAFAIGAIESRDVVLGHNTTLGLQNLDIAKSTYRLESYILLTAVIADVTGLEVLSIAHAVVPVLMCAWVVSVLVLLHTSVLPGVLYVSIGAHFLLLIALDGHVYSYGYHAIPRFIHGKGPFVTAMIPLIAVLSVVALKQASWTALFTLAGAIVIGLGFTANAIYAGPLCAALVGFAFFLTAGDERWRALRLALIVIYPAFLGAYLLIFDPPFGSEFDITFDVRQSLAVGLGTQVAVLLFLGVLLAAVCLPLIVSTWRPVAIYCAGILLFVLNEFLWPIYADYVTGRLNFRLLWAIPFPFILAVIIGMAWTTQSLLVRVPIVFVLLLGVASPGSIIHHAGFGPAALKVPAEDFAVAEKLRDTLQPSDLLLAPEEIATWVTTLERSPFVVESRLLYILQRVDPDFAEVLADRRALFEFWSFDAARGRELPPAPSIGVIDKLGVSALLVDRRRAQQGPFAEALEEAGFKKRWESGPYRLLTRP